MKGERELNMNENNIAEQLNKHYKEIGIKRIDAMTQSEYIAYLIDDTIDELKEAKEFAKKASDEKCKKSMDKIFVMLNAIDDFYNEIRGINGV